MKLKKFVAILTVAAIASQTACSFEFLTDNPALQGALHVSQSAWETLDDLLAKTDLKKNVEGLKTDLNDWINKKLLTEAEYNYYVEFQKATLVRVVDGDTIVVEIEGEEYRVRMIGVNTEESVASADYLAKTGKENTEAGKEASNYTKELLKDVKTVYLQKDKGDRDRYNRLLRYVWLEIPEDDKELTTIASEMVNGILIANGQAEVMTIAPNTAHANDFEVIWANQEDYQEEVER